MVMVIMMTIVDEGDLKLLLALVGMIAIVDEDDLKLLLLLLLLIAKMILAGRSLKLLLVDGSDGCCFCYVVILVV